jgi:conjugal transfer pilus assembly protein TraW
MFFSSSYLQALIANLLIVVSLSFNIARGEASKNPNADLIIKDYGTYGHLFNIAEPSMLEEIMEKLELAKENGTLEQLQNKFAEKVKARIVRPVPVANLKKATIDRSWTYDPTYTQKTNIIDDQGRVIIEAGTTINPLTKLKWGEALIFIDGEDKSQVQWANKMQGKIVLTNGTPLLLAEQLKRPVYFDQGGILCQRFKIEAMPAVIEQDGLLLKVSEVKI